MTRTRQSGMERRDSRRIESIVGRLSLPHMTDIVAGQQKREAEERRTRHTGGDAGVRTSGREPDKERPKVTTGTQAWAQFKADDEAGLIPD